MSIVDSLLGVRPSNQHQWPEGMVRGKRYRLSAFTAFVSSTSFCNGVNGIRSRSLPFSFSVIQSALPSYHPLDSQLSLSPLASAFPLSLSFSLFSRFFDLSLSFSSFSFPFFLKPGRTPLIPLPSFRSLSRSLSRSRSPNRGSAVVYSSPLILSAPSLSSRLRVPEL